MTGPGDRPSEPQHDERDQAKPSGGDTRGPLVNSADASAADRVVFAWHRSGLAFAGIGLALLRHTLPKISARPTVGVILISVGLVSTVAALLIGDRTRRPVMTLRTQMRLITGGTIAIGALALLLSVGN